MLTAAFSYHLPPQQIAQTPARPRDSARLLVYQRQTGQVTQQVFRNLPKILQSGDVLVLNETKVIPARLRTQAGREIFLLKALKPKTWRCLVRGGKHFLAGQELTIAPKFTGKVQTVLPSGERVITFRTPNFLKALTRYGHTPLPPYIQPNDFNTKKYQTIFARRAGSVAAPTAGLHFTPRVFRHLKQAGQQVVKINLTIGSGTFLPVKTKQLEDHPMHTEAFELSPAAVRLLNQAKKAGRRIFAVGSTSCRVLESCVQANGFLKAQKNQTALFIKPGYQFKFIDGLLTNFHLPCSTLIMLVAAFLGREKTLELYHFAVQAKYRFYSFGDAMLLL